jgi:UDPglucose 6-dehydrogenase
MRIGVIGTGRLGLAFALLCEKAGYQVIVSDRREDYVYNLQQKICNTQEPLIQKNLFEVNKFSATTNNIEIIENSDIIFTFVPTTSTTEGNFDTSTIFEVVNNFFEASKQDISIFNKKFVVGSTTNVGEVEQIQNRLSMFSIQVAYNPQFADYGEILKNIQESDIVLIGTEYQELTNDLIEIYGKLQTTPVNAHIMSSKASEITKIGISSFISAKMVFANMIGNTMKKIGVSNETGSVLNAIGSDSRVGKKLMNYGFGFGGSHLPKDNRCLGKLIKDLELTSNIPTSIDKFNQDHSNFLKKHFLEQNPDKSVPFVIKNLSYKKGTDILEESQQFKLCLDLLEEGYYVNVIEIDSVVKQLFEISNQFEGKLKFYKTGTNPEGYLIEL